MRIAQKYIYLLLKKNIYKKLYKKKIRLYNTKTNMMKNTFIIPNKKEIKEIVNKNK